MRGRAYMVPTTWNINIAPKNYVWMKRTTEKQTHNTGTAVCQVQGFWQRNFLPLKYNSGNYQILSTFVKALYTELEADQRELSKWKHQLDATILIILFHLILLSTCFGCYTHPSSGASNMYNQLWYSLITVIAMGVHFELDKYIKYHWLNIWICDT